MNQLSTNFSAGIGTSSWAILARFYLTAKVTKPNPRLLPVSRSKATKESSICENGCEVSHRKISQSLYICHLSKLGEEVRKVLLLCLPRQVSDDCSRHGIQDQMTRRETAFAIGRAIIALMAVVEGFLIRMDIFSARRLDLQSFKDAIVLTLLSLGAAIGRTPDRSMPRLLERIWSPIIVAIWRREGRTVCMQGLTRLVWRPSNDTLVCDVE